MLLDFLDWMVLNKLYALMEARRKRQAEDIWTKLGYPPIDYSDNKVWSSEDTPREPAEEERKAIEQAQLR